MSRRAIAALLALALCNLRPSPASAGPAPGDPQHCQSVAEANAEIDAAIAKVGGARETLSGKAAQDYLDVVNAEPPTSHITSPLIVLFERETDTVIGAQTAEDKICIVARVGARIHAKALKAAKGEDT